MIEAVQRILHQSQTTSLHFIFFPIHDSNSSKSYFSKKISIHDFQRINLYFYARQKKTLFKPAHLCHLQPSAASQVINFSLL